MSTPNIQLNQIAETLNNLGINIKAEVIAGLLIDLGINKTSIQTNFTSNFNRSYRKDVYNSEYRNDQNKIDLFIPRNGFYDMLPEGLFHSEYVEKEKKITVKHLLDSHNIQRKEEANARLFFKPFENHLFHLLVENENKEKSLLNNSHEFRSFFKQFWGIESWIKDNEFVFMIRILPYAKKIKGNTKHITQLLSCHLKKEISYKRSWIEINLPNYKEKTAVILGQNFIIGNTSDSLPHITFVLHDISDEELLDYTPNGYYYKFIKMYFEFLLPIEIEYDIKVKPNYNQTKEEFGILGHSTKLQILKN
ncbi:hypothetical protein [Plebeiibacterium sediminum]|uniref:Uncharacterized protein n=1 Tax=Plebeiibacterium sediminum TaxID=2992112 RepID=A0AAE3M8D7_9BACT|nr:hypothetical protein [Plebeiobacterium sediminum]MCW3788872.1 hypothetical protein [Plebeiobacterium sediminum]